MSVFRTLVLRISVVTVYGAGERGQRIGVLLDLRSVFVVLPYY
jgi:hypothetical protein